MTTSGSPDAQKTAWHVALLGGYDMRGAWQLRPRTVAISPVGGIDLDLTEATRPHRESFSKLDIGRRYRRVHLNHDRQGPLDGLP